MSAFQSSATQTFTSALMPNDASHDYELRGMYLNFTWGIKDCFGLNFLPKWILFELEITEHHL